MDIFQAEATLDVFVPGPPVFQVHVDVSAQLRAAAAENPVDFVLIKSRFLEGEKHLRPRPLLTPAISQSLFTEECFNY